jgi:hypothetical protein
VRSAERWQPCQDGEVSLCSVDQPLTVTVSADFAVLLKLCDQKLSSDQDGVL